MNSSKRQKKLIVFLEGGTGNQLFQLMACENLALIHNRNSYYSDHLLGGQRKLETEAVANKLGIKKIPYSKLSGIKIINEINICHPSLFNRFPDYNLLPNEDIILRGFFQNYRIFSESGVKKLKEFSKKNAESLKLPKKDKIFIAIHLRELHATKGTVPLKSIDNLNLNYYKRALEVIDSENQINNKVKIKKVMIFSDMFKDFSSSLLYIPLLKLLNSKGYEVTLADKQCKNTLQVIALISRAKYVICSNSTFSWWGGYLSDGTTICPIFSIWESNLNTPDNWIQINDGNRNPKTYNRMNIYKVKRLKTRSYNVRFLLINKINTLLRNKIYSNIFGGLLRRYEKLKIKSFMS